MNTSKNYRRTLAQQEDLNWDGNPSLDAEVDEKDNWFVFPNLVKNWIEGKPEEDLEEEAVVQWFYD